MGVCVMRHLRRLQKIDVMEGVLYERDAACWGMGVFKATSLAAINGQVLCSPTGVDFNLLAGRRCEREWGTASLDDFIATRKTECERGY